MKAELEDGSVVELEKDCGCVTHVGPHWLHMDEMDRERNLKMKARGDMLSLLGFSREEHARLGRKIHEMKTRKIKRLIETDVKTIKR